jgi:S-(hydroxymethyl)glutathione dehydrogenase/alcohol dehydrogenase
VKAAILHAPNQPLTVEDVDIRKPLRGEVLVRTAASGVCHSDLHFVEGLWPAPLPIVLGHEAAGVVEEVGEGVTYVTPGDHVIVSFTPFCGQCADCVSGSPHLCTNPVAAFPAGRQAPPRLTRNGGVLHQFAGRGPASFAEYMLVSESSLVKIPAEMPLDKAALIGCAVTTGIGAVINTARVHEGDTIAVIGTGGVGLNVIQGGVLAAASKIIAIDVLDSKLDYARTMGATHTVNAATTDPVKAVQELTGGRGVDYAFEAIGSTQAARQAFDMVRRGGTAVIVGMMPWGSEIALPGPAFLGEKKCIGSYYGSTRFRIDMPRLCEFYLQGKIKLDELVTRRYQLDEINEAFGAMKRGEVARSIIPLTAA